MDWTIFNPIISALAVAVPGWWVLHYFSARRDRTNARREMRLKYLLESYRRLEGVAHRPSKTPDQHRDFESAVADIQLLGTSDQVQIMIKTLKQYRNDNGVGIDEVLRVLRNDLRREMELSVEVENPLIFRFINDK